METENWKVASVANKGGTGRAFPSSFEPQIMVPTLSGRKVETRTSSVRAERQGEDRDHGAFRLCVSWPS